MPCHLLFSISCGKHWSSLIISCHWRGQEVVPHCISLLRTFVFRGSWTNFLTNNACRSLIINSNILDLKSVLSCGTGRLESKWTILLLNGRGGCTFRLSLVLASCATIIAWMSVISPRIVTGSIMRWWYKAVTTSSRRWMVWTSLHEKHLSGFISTAFGSLHATLSSTPRWVPLLLLHELLLLFLLFQRA